MGDPSDGDGRIEMPESRVFEDFAGRRRRFRIETSEVPTGWLVSAIEDVEGPGGYVFEAFAEANPVSALGELHQRIERGLAIRYLKDTEAGPAPTHDRVRGRIAYGGVVIDGRFLGFEQFAELLQTHEGFAFDLYLGDRGAEG